MKKSLNYNILSNLNTIDKYIDDEIKKIKNEYDDG